MISRAGADTGESRPSVRQPAPRIFFLSALFFTAVGLVNVIGTRVIEASVRVPVTARDELEQAAALGENCLILAAVMIVAHLALGLAARRRARGG